MMWMLGGRDPSVFESPDEFLLTRDNKAMKPFGGGIHNCPGRNVSRMLGHTLLRHLTAPGLHVEPVGDDPQWMRGSLLHELDGGFHVSLRTD
jgi:cytochrome P450